MVPGKQEAIKVPKTILKAVILPNGGPLVYQLWRLKQAQ